MRINSGKQQPVQKLNGQNAAKWRKIDKTVSQVSQLVKALGEASGTPESAVRQKKTPEATLPLSTTCVWA